MQRWRHNLTNLLKAFQIIEY